MYRLATAPRIGKTTYTTTPRIRETAWTAYSNTLKLVKEQRSTELAKVLERDRSLSALNRPGPMMSDYTFAEPAIYHAFVRANPLTPNSINVLHDLMYYSNPDHLGNISRVAWKIGIRHGFQLSLGEPRVNIFMRYLTFDGIHRFHQGRKDSVEYPHWNDNSVNREFFILDLPDSMSPSEKERLANEFVV